MVKAETKTNTNISVNETAPTVHACTKSDKMYLLRVHYAPNPILGKGVYM